MRSLLFPTLFFYSLSVFSQCCSPGNPIGGSSNLGVMENGSWKIILSYRYSYSGRYFEGYKPVDPYFVESGYFNYMGLLLSHAISSRITIDLEGGYFINKGQTYVDGIIPNKKMGYGISDITLTPKFNIIRKNDWEISTGVGIKMAMGQYDKKFNGAIAELDIQPSTGAFDYIHTLFISKEILPRHWRFFFYNRIEIKKPNPLQYKYGDLFSTAIYGSYSLSSMFDIIVQLRNEFRAKDERPDQAPPYKPIKIPVSGSEKIFLAPQLNINVRQTLSISILVDFPLYQHYNGQQLATSYAFAMVLAKKFNNYSKVQDPIMNL